MRKLFKIILSIFIIVMAVLIACAAVIALDVAGALATDTHLLPHGEPIGQALVVYSPGLSGGAKDVATKIGYNLQDKGYNVVLAGIKSSAAEDISGYNVIVVGGPIYADSPTKTVQEYLANLSPTENQKIGVFGYGTLSSDNSDYSAVLKEVTKLPEDNSLTVNAVVKVASGADVDAQCQDFVNRLTA